MLAAVQEAVLQAALEIRCKPHLHPYIHSMEFISTAERVVRGEGEEWRERDGGGTEESTVALGTYKKKKKKKRHDPLCSQKVKAGWVLFNPLGPTLQC